MMAAWRRRAYESVAVGTLIVLAHYCALFAAGFAEWSIFPSYLEVGMTPIARCPMCDLFTPHITYLDVAIAASLYAGVTALARRLWRYGGEAKPDVLVGRIRNAIIAGLGIAVPMTAFCLIAPLEATASSPYAAPGLWIYGLVFALPRLGPATWPLFSIALNWAALSVLLLAAQLAVATVHHRKGAR
jgi:hypothetical protein